MSHYSKKDVQEPLLFDGGEEKAAEPEDDGGVLTRQQINQCMMDIQDMHPLLNKARPQHIVPCLKHIMGEPKPEFDAQLRIGMLQKLGLKLPKTEKKVNKNPFLLLGYGVNSYFDVLEQMMKMFAFISIFFIPIMAIYSDNSQNQLSHQAGLPYMVSSLSMGNLGGSRVNCHQNQLVFNAIDLVCPVGVIATKGNMKFGVISSQVTNQIYCMPETLDDYVKNNTKVTAKNPTPHYTAAKPYQNCSAGVDHSALEAKINEECDGKLNCTLSLANSAVYTQDFIDDNNVDLFFNILGQNSGGSSTIKSYDAFNAGHCGHHAAFYIQYPCLIPKDQTTTRKLYGLFIGCITVFIYLYVLVYLDYIKCVQMNEYVEFDVDTITAGDYTVCFDLKDTTYTRFSTNYYDSQNPMCENSQFKLYLQNELESRINAMEDLEFRDEEFREEPCKIAQITFAYENGWIIDTLKKRGAAIGGEKYDKVEEINKEIHEKITTDKEFLDKCQLPCSVFVTFEDEEGTNRALGYNAQPQMDLLGEQIEIEESAEPTDIIWENREYSPLSRLHKTIVAWVVIITMLAVSFICIFEASVYGNHAADMFPQNVDCTAVEKQWGHLMNEKKDWTLWQNAAVLQYANNKKAYDSGGKTYYTDVWPCFCGQSKLPTSLTTSKPLDLTHHFGLEGKVKKDAAGNLVKPAPICEIHLGIKFTGLFVSSSISFVIIAINIVLKKIVTGLLTWVKEATKSEMLSSITNGVFITLFLNTGLLLTLANANMTEHPPHFITNNFQGPYYDYDPEWYPNVGFLILKTMMINAFLPFVGLAMGWAIPTLHRRMDMKWGKDRYVTKKTTMIQYKKCWSGGEYVMHVKDSGLLLIVFVSCMYGVGMPLLFPVAAFNFGNQYVCERLMACYQVKLPPSLDDKLTNNLIAMMKWAPLIMLFNGYWMLSNQQIFNNKWSLIPNSDSTTHMPSGHFIELKVDWAAPMLIMSFCAVFLVLFIRFCPAELRMLLHFSLQEKEIKVDEDLPNFFDTILLNQADELVNEEKNLKAYYGIECNDPDTVQKLDEATQPKKSMMGTPWYTILSNDAYKEDFAYTGAFIEEREKLIEDGAEPSMDSNGDMTEQDKRIKCEQSDLVIILLNIAVVPDSVVTQIPNFGPGWQKQFLALMDNYKHNVFKGENYEYQNPKLEEQYAQFVKDKESKDQLHLNEKKDFESKQTEFTTMLALKKQNSSVGIN